LEHTKGMDEERKPSERAELFADSSAHPKAQTRGGDEGDSVKWLRCHARRARHG
jgi:hypothetical protein